MANIKIKNSQLNNDTVEFLNKLIDTDINATVAFRLMRIVKEVSSLLDDKVKMERKIIEKWAAKDDEGNFLRPKDDEGNDIEGSIKITNVDLFNKEMADFMNIENDLGYEKINFEDIQLKTAKANELIKVDFLFT